MLLLHLFYLIGAIEGMLFDLFGPLFQLSFRVIHRVHRQPRFLRPATRGRLACLRLLARRPQHAKSSLSPISTFCVFLRSANFHMPKPAPRVNRREPASVATHLLCQHAWLRANLAFGQVFALIAALSSLDHTWRLSRHLRFCQRNGAIQVRVLFHRQQFQPQCPIWYDLLEIHARGYANPDVMPVQERNYATALCERADKWTSGGERNVQSIPTHRPRSQKQRAVAISAREPPGKFATSPTQQQPAEWSAGQRAMAAAFADNSTRNPSVAAAPPSSS